MDSLLVRPLLKFGLLTVALVVTTVFLSSETEALFKIFQYFWGGYFAQFFPYQFLATFGDFIVLILTFKFIRWLFVVEQTQNNSA